MVKVVGAEYLAVAVLVAQVVNVVAVAYNAPAAVDLFQGGDREFLVLAHLDFP